MFACFEEWNMHNYIQWIFNNVQWIKKCLINFLIKLLMIAFATSISTLTLTFLNNVCEIHRQSFINVWIHFCQRNIIRYYDSIRVIWLYIAIDHNDADCSKYHQRFMLLCYRQLLISMTFAFDSIMNHWQQILNN